MNAIAPGYGLGTSVTQRDALDDGGIVEMTSVSQYADPSCWKSDCQLGRPSRPERYPQRF